MVTHDDLATAIAEVLAALTNSQGTGILDRQQNVLERLSTWVEVLELESQHRLPAQAGIDNGLPGGQSPECTPNAPPEG